MCSFLAGMFLIFILSAVCMYEVVRWYATQEECQLKRNNFHKLLASDVCKSGYGESVDAACAKATLELRATTLWMCTAAAWWRSGEVYRMYTHATDSYIFLGVLILAPILYTIRLAFDHWGQRVVDNRVERLLAAAAASQQPQQLYLNDVRPRLPGMRSNFVRSFNRDDGDE